ncbi:MAG TPA: hypothetical protein VK034_24660, partial [Enhygromyxa sp.]|nr:hypothetical protein [Enhygromyxa sp.]
MSESTPASKSSAPGRRRSWIAAAVVALALAAWWQWRVDVHLWRLRAHDHKASRRALQELGPGALPDIHAELRELGSEPVGDYRSELVRVVVDIRRDDVAGRIGASTLEAVAAALEPADAEMLDALALAIAGEPDLEQQRRMVAAIVELDFNTLVPLTCAVFPELAPQAQEWLLASFEPVRLAWDRVDGEAQQTMRAALTCFPPLLVAELERSRSSANEQPRAAGFHAQGIAELLGEFDELEPELLARLIELVGATTRGEVVEAIADELGDRLVGADAEALQAALVRAVRQAEGDRPMILHSIARLVANHEDDGLSYDALFCESFAHVDAELRSALIDERRLGSTACVHDVMMTAYERRLAELDGTQERDLWMLDVERVLAQRLTEDP